jgi:hypothetical protein
MFKWDGTDVTEFISKCDIFGAKFNRLKYWVIQYTDPETKKISEDTCIIKSSKNSLPCLVDELKVIFGLPKLGTHWCRLNGKTYTLVKCIRTIEGYIKEEITLNMIAVSTPLLIMQIQEVFAFRELLGVTCSYESSIIIREGKTGPYPISFNEPNMATGDNKVIPFTILDKWFEDSNLDDVVKRLCRINNIDRLATVIYELRKQIDEIIERVDRRAITYKNCIIDRITERLQTTLN